MRITKLTYKFATVHVQHDGSTLDSVWLPYDGDLLDITAEMTPFEQNRLLARVTLQERDAQALAAAPVDVEHYDAVSKKLVRT